MLSRLSIGITLFLLLVAAACREDPGRLHRMSTGTQNGITQKAAAAGGTPDSQQKQYPDLTDRQVYEKVNASIPDEVRQLATGALEHVVGVDDALREFRSLARRVAVTEVRGLTFAGAGPSGKVSRMFADWARTQLGGVESLQELDTDQSARSGPDGEVLLHSGELCFQQIDHSLPSRSGLGFTFARVYRSHVDYNGPLGLGWDHNHNQRLILDGDSTDTATRADWYSGQRRISFYRKGNTWLAEKGAFYGLSLNDKQAVIETPTLNHLIFERALAQQQGTQRWRIKMIATRHDAWRANTMRYVYDGDRLSSIVDPYGNEIRLHYDEAGLLRQLRHRSFVVQYGYDNLGRLNSVATQAVACSVEDAIEIEQTFEYDKFGDSNRSWLVSATPPGGSPRKSILYEREADSPDFGQVLEVRFFKHAQSDELLTTWKINRLPDEIANTCTIQVTAPEPIPVEVYTYRTTGAKRRHCDRMPMARRIPARDATWTLNYNHDGLLTTETLPLGGKREYEYDEDNPVSLFHGNLLKERELARPGPIVLEISEIGTRRTYHPRIALPAEQSEYEIAADGKPRVLRALTWEYDERDLELVGSRLGKQTTCYIRNRFGHVVARFDGLGIATLCRYFEEFGEGPAEVNRGGLLAECVRDIAPARVHAELRMAGITPSPKVKIPERAILSAPLSQSTIYSYNANGLTVREQHEGYEIHSLFNKANLLLCHYDTRNDLQLIEYDRCLRKATEYQRITFMPEAEYKGEVRPGIQGRFYQQRFAYDDMGNLSSWVPTEERLGPDGKAPPIVKYARYPSGVLKARTPPGGNTVEMVYEKATGSVRKKTLASRREPSKQLRLQRDISYDAEGFQVAYTDDLGHRHVFKPDSFGRPFSYVSPDRIEHQTFLDGLDRPVRCASVSTVDGKSNLISESTFSYDPEGNLEVERIHRMGKGIDTHGHEAPIDEWHISGQYRYDAVGNRTHVRSLRDDAWTRLEYDGLGRVVLTKGPEGDIETVLYEYEQPVLRSHRVKNQVTQRISRLCDVAVLDSKHRPWLLFRVGTDGNPAFSRSVVQLYDSRGRQVQSATPGLARQVAIIDSLDRVTQEISEPLETSYNEETKVVSSQFDPDGRLLKRTLRNSPMAVFTSAGSTPEGPSTQTRLAATRVAVPQITVQEYDEFGRLWKTTMPDGLVRMNEYNNGSMVESITSTHLDKKDFRHVVRLEYDRVRRLLGVRDESSALIQRFEYDDFGNVVRGEDRGNPQCSVDVTRRFDNLGNLLYEATVSEGGPNEVKIAYEYAPARGTRKVSLLGLKGQREDLWQQMVWQVDRAGRVARIAVDSDDGFCQFSYVGSQVILKTLAQGGTELQIDTNTLLEPLNYSLRELSSPEVVCATNYHLNSHGLIDASSAEVPPRKWQRSQFYQHDSLCTLIGELAEDRACSNLAKRRKTVLNDLTAPSAWRARWSSYDQAGNLTTTFRKRFVPTVEANQAESDSNAQFYSPGRPVHVATLDSSNLEVGWTDAVESGVAETSKHELASNRLSTVASRQGIVHAFDFDNLGRLIRFPSITDDQSLSWYVDYDLLGRATKMRGYRTQDEKPDTEKPDIELRFASDVFNRRIVKQVQDYGRTDTSVTVTTYLGGEPAVVMKRGGDKDSSWDVTAQYLWGPATREIIMAVLPADKVEQRKTQEWGRYFLHQDRMLNVFLCTGLKNRKVEVFDIASFWGFGENSATGNLVKIDSTASTEHGSAPSPAIDPAIDKVLDHKRTSWLGGDAPGRITLELDRTAQLSEMAIWTDGFPKSFRVYVAPEGKDVMPSRDKLADWENNARENHWIVYESDQPQRRDDIQDPYRIPLRGHEGKQIVVAWDKAPSMSVREFEVSVVPRNPSCLAFAGQWLDKETGLYYQGARYRIPSMGGKFICPDPLGFFDSDNLYAYAHNDPLTWHDPDGQFVHILIGGGVGAALGGGAYIGQVWWTGEEFSWAKLGIYTVAGGASGAISAATFGAASAYLGTGLAADFLAGGAAGAAGGAGHGLMASGGIVWLETGSFSQGATAGLRSAVVEGAMGFVGGGLGGATLGQLTRGPALDFIGNKTVRGLAASVAAGAVGGGGAGAVGGGYDGYMDAGWSGVLTGSVRGAGRGLLAGAAGGTMAFGIGKGIDMWRGGSRDAQWQRSQRDYWNRAAQSAKDHPGRYSPEDLSRMQRGRAPQTVSPKTGLLESTELHHNTLPQRSGLPGSIINEDWNLLPVSPQEHSAIDPFRHY